MGTTGTGGIDDIDGYLSSRLGLHQRAGTTELAGQAAAILDRLDAGDLDAFFAHFHERASFRFGSGEAVHGKENILGHVRGFLGSVRQMRHKVQQQFVCENTIFIVGEVLYEMTDGRSACIPFCDTWKLASDHRIIEYRVYSDPTPLR